MPGAAARAVAVIRIDQIWLATEPLDMRAGPDTALARVVQVFGSARRLNRGKFHWSESSSGP